VTGYDAIFSAILEEIEPITTLQRPHVKHVTDLAWDIHRCRRLKANIINLARIEAVGAVLTPSVSALLTRPTRVRRGTCGESPLISSAAVRPSAQTRQALIGFCIKLDDVGTRSMVLSLPDVMNLESLMTSAEG
jgi:hypothetical protein